MQKRCFKISLLTIYVKIFSTIFLILSKSLLYSQNSTIESLIQNIPKSDSKTIKDVVNYIKQNSDNDVDKAKAAYCWIANNISYDVRNYFKNRTSYYEPEQVFFKKKAVCYGYSSLFKEFCNQLDIPCEIVKGYDKGAGYQMGQQFNESTHAWNAVMIDSVWQLVDVTWGSGYVKSGIFSKKYKKSYNEKYFELEPNRFILNHLPEVPMWQLLNYTISLKVFAMDDDKILKNLIKNNTLFFHFNDTIKSLYSKDSVEMLLEYGKMAVRFNSNNKLPLAEGMIRIVRNNIESQQVSQFSSINLLDSMIELTENTIKLYKKAKTSRQVMKDLIDKNLTVSSEILADLYSFRVRYFEKILFDESSLQIDSLKFYMTKLTKSFVSSMNLYNTIGNIELSTKTEEYFCSLTLSLYDQLSTVFEIEFDKRKKAIVKKELTALLNVSRKNVSDQCGCKQQLQLLKKLK